MSAALMNARAASCVDVERLSIFIYGGKDRLDRLRHVWNFIENDDIFDKSSRPYLNHTSRYVAACRKIARFAEIANNLELSTLDEIYDAYLAIDENLPIDVHLSMFIPILHLHCSPQQRQLWLQDAMQFRMIGAYAQTELAHGSNIRGIETTATYDIIADEFVIHSPTLTSRKFWPGGLAYTATHAVVYANLLLFGKNLGPHPFMVQIRSTTDLMPLKGVLLSDIGPKLGYNSMDNGMASFDHVRIPRSHMLMGFAQVSGDGSYSKQTGAEKVAYGVMLDVRARIIANSAYVLARVLTISLRYSIVRTQGFDASGKEQRIFDYPTQYGALVPLVAYMYALHLTGLRVREEYNAYGGKHLEQLPDLHATTAGLKALITAEVSDAMEACRKLCGGHGFLASAGFAEIQMSFLPFCTLEGTKEVLYQQTGKYLVKALSAKGPLHANIEYLKQESNTCVDVNEEQSIPTMIRQLLAAMAMRSKALVVAAAASIASNQRDIGVKLEDAFTACAVELCEAAESHAELLIATSFANAVDALKGDPSIDLSAEEKQVLEQLVLLSISKRISEGFGSFIVTNSISTTSFSVIQGTVRRLCKDLAPHALNLAEAYQLSDKRLDSTLGRSDGDVYTAIVEKASQEPLNNGAAEEGQKYLLGMLHRRKRGELEIAVSKKGNRKVTSKL